MSPSREMVGGALGVLGATVASAVALGCSSVRENVTHQCKLILIARIMRWHAKFKQLFWNLDQLKLHAAKMLKNSFFGM